MHDVRNSRFRLSDWVASLEAAELKQFPVSFSPYETRLRDMEAKPLLRKMRGPLPAQAELEAVVSRAKEHPKEHIWLGAHHVLVGLVDMHGFSEARQWEKAQGILGEDD